MRDGALIRGKTIRQKLVTREQVRANKNNFYMFGDNMLGKGLGGQAAAMRGEPNTIGIPTKWAPDMRPGSFFTDEDADNLDVRHAIEIGFDRASWLLAAGYNVVIPADGLGTGLAQLPRRAPRIFAMIESCILCLEKY